MFHLLDRGLRHMVLTLLLFFSLAVTPAMMEPFLEGLPLKQALEEKRIFIVNLKVLDEIQLEENRKVRVILYSLTHNSLLAPTKGQRVCERVRVRAWEYEHARVLMLPHSISTVCLDLFSILASVPCFKNKLY